MVSTKRQIARPLSALHKSLLATPEVQERFWSKVNKTKTCWLWTGQIKVGKNGGYGTLRMKGRMLLAHRLAWFMQNGDIPTDMTLDHVWPRCQNRNCVNPAHLEVVTEKENILRGFSPSAQHNRKTHCIHGHPFTGENLYADKDGRHCRTCKRLCSRRAYRELRAAGFTRKQLTGNIGKLRRLLREARNV